jgi:peptidylprolyl isomerase
MKLIVALLSVATSATLAAQTNAHAPAHRATVSTGHTAANCAKLPEASPKIPALAAGTTCAKILYTLRVDPPVKIDYISPIEGTALQDTLGLGSESFSLLYVDTKVGTGELAQPKKYYSIRYTGYLPDGSIFDSNADKQDQPPFSFPYGAHQVINGWDTGFAGMHVGGKRRLFIPYQLAYGANGRAPKIPPKSMLIFDVELVSQSDTDPTPPATPTPATPPGDAQQAPPTGAKQPPAGAPATSTPPPPSAEPKPQ